MSKVIIIAIIVFIVGCLVSFIVGYCFSSYSKQTNHLGVKKRIEYLDYKICILVINLTFNLEN